MKWLELHLDTQPAGIEPATELLSEYGIDSLMIDEEGDFKDFLENNHQYWDYVDEDLMQSMHGKSRITFYMEDSEEGFNTLAQFRIGLAAFKKQHPEYAPLILSMENVEDADWLTGNLEEIAAALSEGVTEYFGLPFLKPSEPRTGIVTLSSGTLNLRSLPTTDAAVLAQLPNGATVTILGQFDEWYTVEYDGLHGFASSRYITAL